jgi:DNA (cytosine-5)-methyltransferase 1
VTDLRAISLFSNCGAGDLGYAKAGFAFEVMAEIEQRRLDVALLNHPGAVGVKGDLRETLGDVVKEYRRRARTARPALLAACPPCQGMSSARSGRGREADAEAGSRDPRNLLVSVIAEAVDQLRPRVVVVENVPAFLRRHVRHPTTGEAVSAATLLVDALVDRYETYAMVTDLADFGVPQHRTRAFLTFVDRRERAVEDLAEAGEVPFPAATHVGRLVALRKALDSFNLPPLDAVSGRTARSDVYLHMVPVLDELRYRLVAATPHDGGSAWENDHCSQCGKVDVGTEDTLCPRCGQRLPRPVVLDANGAYRLVNGFRTSSYTRMRCDEPAATVTTASGSVGSDRTLHPWENRVLSPLECALLQTIPRDFAWGETLERYGHTPLRAMIGEAVPPRFTRLHGRLLARLLTGDPPTAAMSVDDVRVEKARRALTEARRSR